MANNEERNRLQKDALHDLCYKNRVILNWGTGVGKSKVAADAFDQILRRIPGARFLLIVQESAHKMNWRDDITKHLGEERMKEVFTHLTVECYASLKNYRDTAWDLIVFDEAHHLRSELRMDILSTMTAKRVLALSATINDQGDGEDLLETLNSTFGEFVIKQYDMSDAIGSGILGKPEIHIVALKLNPWQQKSYDDLTKQVDQAKDRYKDKREAAGLEAGDPETVATQDFHDRWMFAANRRKRYLGNIKADTVSHLLDTQLKDKRLVCFCANVKQVEKIGGKDSINAEHTKKENLSVIEAFNSGATNRLFAVGMIQEGQNLNGIEAGVIAQLDGKARSFIQRLGRVMRSETPLIYILFVPDTRDEEYLENALADIDKEFISFDNCEPTPAFRRASGPAAPPAAATPSVIVNYTIGKDCLFEAVDAKGQLFSKINELSGQFVGIGRMMAKNGLFWYQYKLMSGETMSILTVHQKMSISLLMQLVSCRDFGEVRISCGKGDGGYADTQVYAGNKAAAWAKRKLPPKDGQQNSARMIFLDSLVDEINNATGYSEDIF